MKKWLVAFMVTWDVSGFSIGPCNDPKAMDPAVGLCVSPVNMTRSLSLDKEADANALAEKLGKVNTPAYKVANVHVYEEVKKK